MARLPQPHLFLLQVLNLPLQGFELRLQGCASIVESLKLPVQLIRFRFFQIPQLLFKLPAFHIEIARGFLCGAFAFLQRALTGLHRALAFFERAHGLLSAPFAGLLRE
ncbi:hypothetical protein SBV1_2090011 [Verrucomicrobia bacterium]|nr:hypothetical protein SBV1_2090011 [Verrucomicrobiota bacterium]